jgi:MarR family transcriptional regulator, organic hydroperoxide resistance regulator
MTRLNTNFRKAEDSPGFLLWKASNLLQRMHSICLSDLNITPTQFSLMTCLVYLHQDGPVTASRIVDHAGMDKMMVSDLIKTLVKKKLVKRKPNPEDGRSFLLEPTPLGQSITNSSVLKIEALDLEFFKRVKDIVSFQRDLASLVG